MSSRWAIRIAGLSIFVPVVVVFLLALGLRAYCLDCHGFWGDEVNSLDGASLGIPGIFIDRFGYLRNQTPLHYLLLWLTTQPINPITSSVLVRLPSVIVGALTSLVVYGLGKELFGRGQGLVAALLVALSATMLELLSGPSSLRDARVSDHTFRLLPGKG